MVYADGVEQAREYMDRAKFLADAAGHQSDAGAAALLARLGHAFYESAREVWLKCELTQGKPAKREPFFPRRASDHQAAMRKAAPKRGRC
jgi:hypothetical protein